MKGPWLTSPKCLATSFKLNVISHKHHPKGIESKVLLVSKLNIVLTVRFNPQSEGENSREECHEFLIPNSDCD